MKKIYYLFFLSLLLIPTINATTELVPDEVRVNDSIYLIVEWTATENIKNLSLIIDADDSIVFEEYEYNISNVKTTESVFKMFKGTATEIGNYKIKLLKRYFQNGTLIGSVEFFELSVVPDAGVRIVEKIVVPEDIGVEEVEPTTISEESTNTSEEIPIIIKNESSDELELTKKTQDSPEIVSKVDEGLIGPDGIYYILGGLILGILLGVVIAYSKE